MELKAWTGRSSPLGATFTGEGVNFAVFSRVATRVEVCLFDAADPNKEVGRFDLPENTDNVHHGFVPGLKPGQLYGLRVHGPYEPEQGHRCNPAKLLVDPYAREISGETKWGPSVFGYQMGGEQGDLQVSNEDSAAAIPRSVVVDDRFDWGNDKAPSVPWRKSVVYEVHVKGFTQQMPGVPEELRGTYAGFAHPAAIEHLKTLGVTAVELLPVHEAADDSFLGEKGLTNYWGYSTLGFFAPEQRYASRREPGAVVREFKTMVKALHDAGIEVILDVVYNHTCEGNHLGPTLSLKGVDNASYYWLMPEKRHYLDFSGCGNSINASSAPAERLIVDSLRYWVEEMHVDGFRFDLATVLGRTGEGAFSRDASFFKICAQDPVLSQVKLIAEPWDCGSGGYQVGGFPAPWREWNGKYRDVLRKYWKGDEGQLADLANRMAGNEDLYRGAGRRPQASVNFITCHDGFTLHDLVTYGGKHNDANKEHNRDGADDNESWNCGVEGETDDAGINALRERQKRNLLASLFLSQGVPMLCAGDEMANTQGGNNNTYCQDNELSWLDWKLDAKRKDLLAFTSRLIRFRAGQPVLQRRRFFRGEQILDSSTSKDISWYRPDGTAMESQDWGTSHARSLMFMLAGDGVISLDEKGERIVGDGLAICLNAHHDNLSFTLPKLPEGSRWELEFDTRYPTFDVPKHDASAPYEMVGRSIAVFREVK